MEKQVLTEEGDRGKTTNAQLTRTAEALSATLSVSIRDDRSDSLDLTLRLSHYNYMTCGRESIHDF